MNQLAKLRAGVVVAPAGTTTLDIDITSTIVMGTLAINGEPAAAGNSGIVVLRSADGDRVVIANTARDTYVARVVPGSYDVYYTRTATPADTTTPAPANHAAKLQTGWSLAPSATTMLDIDIPSATVSGTITINGTSAGTGDHGTLMLRSAAGDFAPFASTARRQLHRAPGPGPVRPLLLPRRQDRRHNAHHAQHAGTRRSSSVASPSRNKGAVDKPCVVCCSSLARGRTVKTFIKAIEVWVPTKNRARLEHSQGLYGGTRISNG